MSIKRQRVAGFATAVFMSIGLAASASASTLDFTTSTYATTFGPNVVSDTVDGVNFTVTGFARGVDGFRQGAGGGLSFGTPGNGMNGIAIVADQDLVFNSMYGFGHGFTLKAGQMPFNASVDGTDVSVGDMFATTALETVGFGSGPIAVAAGQTFLFYADFGSLVGSSIFASARVKSFDFTVAAVPVPAGLPLLIGGLAFLGVTGRRKRRG